MVDWSVMRKMGKAAVGRGLITPEDAWVWLRPDGTDTAEDLHGAGFVFIRLRHDENPEATLARIRLGMRPKLYDGLCVEVRRIPMTVEGAEYEVIDRGTGAHDQYGGQTPPEGITVHSHQTEVEGGTLDGSAIATGTIDDDRLSNNVMLLDAAQTVTGAKTFGSGDLIATDADLNTPDIDGGTVNGITSLTVVSTTAGTIPMPVMSETQRDAIDSPVEGMWVFNSTTNAPNYYDGSDWQDLTGGGLSSPVAIADGGTGQTNATDAFDALAPASPTKGDMLVYDGSNWVKHDAGSDGQFITYDSAETTGIKNVTLTSSDLGTLIKTTETIRIAKTLYNDVLAGSGTFDISSIDQTFDDLEVILQLRSTAAVQQDVAYLLLNNDSTLTNYQTQALNNTSNTAAGAGNADSTTLPPIAGSTALADNWSTVYIRIPSYRNTTKHKSVIMEAASRFAASNTHRAEVRHIVWESTSAINRITIAPDDAPGDQFATGSRITIIGHKDMVVVTDVELV